MNVAVVHNAAGPESPPDEQDVMDQVDAVSAALEVLGHGLRHLSCTLDLKAIGEDLKGRRTDVVFNLVESLDGSSRLLPLFPALLDHMRIPYTGSKAYTLWVTTQKAAAKQAMHAAGIDTPAWIGPVPWEPPRVGPESGPRFSPSDRWIVKSLWEHASFGLDDSCVVSGLDESGLLESLQSRGEKLGGSCFAETYVDGREFNLSILDGRDGPQVLPPAEIVFSDFGQGRLPIVGYRAKWETDAFEYRHTPRRFDFPDPDAPLISRLSAIALRCWHLFQLRGYARVDFRVDLLGRPWVLEVNANPCLSPDAGFAAALAKADLPFHSAVQRILEASVQPFVT